MRHVLLTEMMTLNTDLTTSSVMSISHLFPDPHSNVFEFIGYLHFSEKQIQVKSHFNTCMNSFQDQCTQSCTFISVSARPSESPPVRRPARPKACFLFIHIHVRFMSLSPLNASAKYAVWN